MAIARVLTLLAGAVLAFPSVAQAAAPWSAPATVDGVAAHTALLTTSGGERVLVGSSSRRSLSPPTVVARLAADGTAERRRTLAIAGPQAAAYGRSGVVVAGSRPALTTRAAERAPVVVALGSVSGDGTLLGRPRVLPGTRGQRVSSAGANAAGTIAVVTASMYGGGRPERALWVRRGGSFRRLLTFRPGTDARDTAVAVGPRGDVLLAWQARRTIHARHVGPGGRAGAPQRLGRGVQSALQARIAGGGRLEVAWQSQRVSEGDALTPAAVSYASAPRGARFGRARVVGGSSLTGTGRYVMRPGVRLAGTGRESSVLAWTQYDGSRFRVQVADVADGAVGAPQTVSPAGDDAVLGDLAVSPTGGQLVLWLTGTRGADRSGPQNVAAAVRPPGAAAFGAPELVAGTAPFAPAAAVDAQGRGLAASTSLDGRTGVAVRPPG